MKLSALTKWLVATLTTISMALGAWAGTAIISNSTNIAEVRADQKSDRQFLLERLDRMEDKIDRIERFLRRDR